MSPALVPLLLLLLLGGAQTVTHYELEQIEGGSVQYPIPGLRFPLSVWFKGRSSRDFAEILRVEDEDQMRNLSRHWITFDDYQYLHLDNLRLSDEGEYKVIADSPEEVQLHMTVSIKPSFKVIGSQDPVHALVGEDVVLPCRLVPPLSAEDIQVRWFRNNNFESLVHLYENGRDRNEQQLPEYRGRTEMIRDHITNGNMSLRIRNARKDDGGSYTCHVQHEVYEEATLELRVGAQTVKYYELEQREGGYVQCPVPGLRFPLSVWFKGRSSGDFAEILRVEDEDQRRTLSRRRITFDDHRYMFLDNLHLSDGGEYKVTADSPEEVLLHIIVTVKASFKVIGSQDPVRAIVGEDVVLPCSLVLPLSAEDIQMRWFRNNNFESLVHLYENGKDRNEQQLPEYRGRTEMIRDHITNGNVSLRIRNARKDDGGSYTCHIQHEEATLELKVDLTNTIKRHRYRLLAAAGLGVVLTVLVACWIRWKSKRSPPQGADITILLLQNGSGRGEIPLQRSQDLSNVQGCSRV